MGSLGDGVYGYSDYHYALCVSHSQYINLFMWIGFTVYLFIHIEI